MSLVVESVRWVNMKRNRWCQTYTAGSHGDPLRESPHGTTRARPIHTLNKSERGKGKGKREKRKRGERREQRRREEEGGDDEMCVAVLPIVVASLHARRSESKATAAASKRAKEREQGTRLKVQNDW